MFFDPALLISGWLNMMLGMVDTLIAACLTPLFGMLGIPIPSIFTILAGI